MIDINMIYIRYIIYSKNKIYFIYRFNNGMIGNYDQMTNSQVD